MKVPKCWLHLTAIDVTNSVAHQRGWVIVGLFDRQFTWYIYYLGRDGCTVYKLMQYRWVKLIFASVEYHNGSLKVEGYSFA